MSSLRRAPVYVWRLLIEGELKVVEQDLARLPQWVQWWINFIVFVPTACMFGMLFNRLTRIHALVTFVLFVLGGVSVMLIYNSMGMVRLLGLGHVVFWTPAVIFLLNRVRATKPPQPFAAFAWITILTLGAALVFDYLDVIRWLFGERTSMV